MMRSLKNWDYVLLERCVRVFCWLWEVDGLMGGGCGWCGSVLWGVRWDLRVCGLVDRRVR